VGEQNDEARQDEEEVDAAKSVARKVAEGSVASVAFEPHQDG
jgi:hypothetical protein